MSDRTQQAWALVKFLMSEGSNPAKISGQMGGRVSARTIYRWANNGSGPQQASDLAMLLGLVREMEAEKGHSFEAYAATLEPPAKTAWEAKTTASEAESPVLRELWQKIRAALAEGDEVHVESLMQQIDGILDPKPEPEPLPAEKGEEV